MKEIYEKDCGVVYLGSFFEAFMTTAMAKGKDVADPFNPNTNKKRIIRVVPVPAWREWFLAMGYQIATIPFAEVFSTIAGFANAVLASSAKASKPCPLRTASKTVTKPFLVTVSA